MTTTKKNDNSRAKTSVLAATATTILVVAAQSAVAHEGHEVAGPLEEVLVLGTRLEESLPQVLAQYGNRLEVITAEDIRQGGFNDISQALQMLAPGLYVSPKNGPFDYVDVSLQGSRRNEILWLIDGVRISNRLYNTTTPLDTLPVHMIERIEVLKGGQGIFYGTQSVAGVINVITKSFSDELDLGVGVGFDTNYGRHGNGYVRGKLGEVSLVGYVSYDAADGFQPYRDLEIQPSATLRKRGYDVQNIGGKAAYQFTDRITTSVQYQYTDAHLDFAAPQKARERYNDRQEHIFSGKFDYAVTDNFDIYLKAYYHEWTTHYTQIDNAPIPVVSDAEFWGYKDFGFNLMGQYTIINGLDVLGGFERQEFNGRDEVLLIDDKTEEVNAFFLQLRSSPELLSRTHFALGARYSESQEGVSKTVYNASAQVDVLNNLYLRALAGTAFRLPDAYELYAVDPFDILGNPQLKPESSTNYELGVGGNVSDALFTWEVLGFKRNVKDLISDDGTMAINSEDEIEVTGGEVVLAVALDKSWRASADYTYSKAQAKGSDEQFLRIPKRVGKLKLDYTSPDGMHGVGVNSVYVGHISQSVSGVGVEEFGNYWVFDLTGYTYFDSAQRHRVGLRMENVFHRDYATSVTRGVRDVGGASYRVDNLGSPQTIHLQYDYRFRGK